MDTMPTFTMKAKDKLALPAIAHYAELCRSEGLDDQAAEVDKAVAEMTEWQDRNPELMKLPDHAHVPVSQP